MSEMFSAILKEVTGVLDRRFLLNVFFPSLVFWGLLVVVLVSGQGDLAVAAQAWDEQGVTLKALEIVGFIAWATFFAGILSSQLTAILRLYEGYWDLPLGRYLRAVGQRRHRARLVKLNTELEDNPSQYEDIYLGYPLPTQPEQVMPTCLGNILKNAELYPMDRYEIDAVLIWPRLHNALPQRFAQTIAEARGALDFMLVISSLGGAFALLSGVYLLIIGAPWWLFLVCFWGGLLVAWLAYQSALGSAVLYAQQIKAAFDLYRNELLKQMHLPLPATPDEEKTRWREVGQFLYRNLREKPELWAYTDATSVSPSKQRRETWLQKLLRSLGL
jgi:hypothetical protein